MSNKTYHKLLVQVVIACCFIAFAFTSRAESVKPNIPFTDIVQDNAGFLWASSAQGLFRYDGNSFLVFNTDSQLIKFPTSWVQTVYSENEYIVWVGFNLGGLIRVDLRDYSTQHFLPDVPIKTITVDAKGGVWVGSTNSLYRLNVDSKIVEQVYQDFSIERLLPFGDNILIGANDGLYILDTSIPDTPLNKLLSNYVYDIEKGKRSWFIASNPYLYRLFPNGSLVRMDSDEDATALRLAYDKDLNHLWVSRIDKQIELRNADSYIRLPHQLNKSTGRINSMLVDRSGTLWVARDAGLVRHSQATVMLQPNTALDRKFKIQRYGNQLVAATANSVNTIDFNTGRKQPLQWINEYLYGNDIYSIYLQKNQLWLGTRKGLLVADLDQQIIGIGKNQAGVNLLDDKILSIKNVGESNQLLVGTENSGLNLIDVNKGIVANAGKGELFATSISENGDIVYATNTELVVLDSNFNESKRISFTDQQTKISSILLDGDKVWLVSFGGGIYHGSILTQQFAKVPYAGASLLATDIIKDRYGTVWIATHSGLFYVTQKTEQVQSLRLVKFNGAYSMPSQSLLMWDNDTVVGSSRSGLLTWDVRTVNNNNIVTNLRTSKILHGDQVQSLSLGNDKSILEFPENNEGIRLTIMADNYSPWATQSLEYKILGVYDNWRMSETREISLPYLSADQYRLQVRYPGGSNVLEQPIIIIPPAWKHPLAIAAYTIFALVILLLTAHKVSRLLRSKEQDVIDVHQKMQVLQSGLDRSLDNKISGQVKELAQSTLALRHMQNIPAELKMHMEHIIAIASNISNGLNRVREDLIPKSLLEDSLLMGLQELADTRESLGSDISLQGEWEQSDVLDTQERLVGLKIAATLINTCDEQQKPIDISLQVIDNWGVELIFTSDAKFDRVFVEIKNQLRPVRGQVKRISRGIKVNLLYDMDRLVKQIVGADAYISSASQAKH